MDPARKKVIAALGILGALGLIVAFITLLWKAERRNEVCQGIQVTIQDSVSIGFVTEADVLGYLGGAYGTLQAVPVDSINLAAVEHRLNEGRGILNSEVYLTPDGILHADIRQRSPIVRLQTPQGAFYCDGEGYLMPVSPRFITRVQVVSGEISMPVSGGFCGFLEEGPERDYLASLLELLRYVDRTPLWRENIGQFFVEKGGELVLILRQRKEHFLFGQPGGYEAKLRRIADYLSRVAPMRELSGEAPYKSVNVQYKGQIICKNK